MDINTTHLTNKKNLLAFSSGIDSSALFFVLLRDKIEFDIAIVDYGLRQSSKEEVKYAKSLAQKYNKKIHLVHSPQFESNLEKNMRDFRYNFFDTLMSEFHYDNLITAHQLNDRFEWFLMQLSRGAGLVELLGFDEVSKRKEYNIIRPLFSISRDEIEEYLKKHNIKHFIDSTNSDIKFERNLMRVEFANEFVRNYKDGVKKSFEYLELDCTLFEQSYKKIKQLYLFESQNDIIDIRTIDKILKIEGILLSKLQKDEILSTKDCVVGGKVAICFENDKIYIAPFVKVIMPKDFKEKCRVEKIPPKIRGYLFKEDLVKSLLEIS